MENCQDFKLNIAEGIQNNSSDNLVFERKVKVPSELSEFEIEATDCIPRRNGLFSITGNLKIHRNYTSGK